MPAAPPTKPKKHLVMVLLLVVLVCGGAFAAWQFGLFGTAATPTEAAQALTWQEQYDLGVRYVSEGDYQEAVLAFTAAIEIDPKQPEAYLALADVYVVQGALDAAIEILAQGYEQTADDRLEEQQAELEQANDKQAQESVPEPQAEPEESQTDDAQAADPAQQAEEAAPEEADPAPEAVEQTPDTTAENRAIYQSFVRTQLYDAYTINYYQFADLDQDGTEEMLLIVDYDDGILFGTHSYVYTLIGGVVTEEFCGISNATATSHTTYQFVTYPAVDETKVLLLQTSASNAFGEYYEYYTLVDYQKDGLSNYTGYTHMRVFETYQENIFYS